MSRDRLISLLEFALGAGIVIGHNVYHLVPNEVPILFVLGWISIRLRDGGWKAVGLTPPASWSRTALAAFVAAAALQVTSEIITDPITSRLFHRPPDLSGFGSLVGNLGQALGALALVWTFAAFGEEMGYRGYLMRRAADIGGRTTAAWWAALVAVSVLFGFGHVYQGPSGIIDTGVSGLILGGAYLLSGRNLWVPILAHGLSDTFAVVVVYLGWADNVAK